ncbi:MAG: preprotein translocase subunit SecG [Spiroplasma poulsonii]|uniref:Protein-export membrane protein SecG n=1 Tax=Spiroplasma poulsonii TaxID=2138 RepID=A0A2P6FFT3_9MOLU|nr:MULTISPECIES: preprotein translocase subunit SecG [Spiroplasma]KAF0850116.1 preprotein translocase subunit SecG [Spiroplasma poulsonii]MBH8622467.1 preprotein translocase subunit SecG [Spiroplasma sp. hyd1]MBW1242027.1 preprotein translocase subunit SecG [Spiroplasma poulsonii]MBW3058105.1 preprotein translocase subunit SecG [Spiroplasma poulsonii]PQM32293.1 preprotein translocase subunit SecG [Spiroplasma poulsonii]
MSLSSMMLLAIDSQTANTVIYVFEIVALIVSIIMIIIGLLQNKKAQTGLSALNGGNDELFANSKERGLDRTLSIFMLSFGSTLLIVTLLISLLTKVLF